MAESNGSLPPGGWLTVICRLTACTPGSAPGPTLGIQCGKPLPFTFFTGKSQSVRILKIDQHLTKLRSSRIQCCLFDSEWPVLFHASVYAQITSVSETVLSAAAAGSCWWSPSCRCPSGRRTAAGLCVTGRRWGSTTDARCRSLEWWGHWTVNRHNTVSERLSFVLSPARMSQVSPVFQHLPEPNRACLVGVW